MWIRFFRPDASLVWRDPEVRRRLRWYRSVMLDETPAKFMIIKSIRAVDGLKELREEKLWNLHEELHDEAEELFKQYYGSGVDYEKLKPVQPSYLDLKIELAKRILRRCRFCEWRCGVDRLSGIRGVCGLTEKAYVASFFHHYGEEAPLIGTDKQGGSGTIFFVSCNFHCVFCQNWDISHPRGKLEDAGV
ncbi:MAG TPA: pyruvate formate lyase-activating protein, partial [Nitrososphaeria archaeon]|nr:pyruvate formate lyase-activating protein [Nitrososphaeria archaeon]